MVSVSVSVSISASDRQPLNMTDPKTNGAQPKQKSTRASKPKVKTGCRHCKNRRVKCDETRPQCVRCVKAGRTCDGFPAARKRSGEVAVPRIAPRPDPSSISSPTHTIASFESPPDSRSIIPRNTHTLVRPNSRITPPTTPVVQFTLQSLVADVLPFDSQEGRYFQVFRTHTANELSGFFDSDFWTRSVLQESHAEACIRHAVVALGALYKTLEKVSESPPGSPTNNHTFDAARKHYEFALQQYAKSVTRLRESMANNETNSQRTILISVVLFTCFESFTGNHTSAITQIQHGLGLLEERRQDRRQPLSKRQNDVVEDELVQMFTRLAIQAKSYDMAFHFPHPYVIRLTPAINPSTPQSPTSPSEAGSPESAFDSSIPETFRTLQEARTALDSLVERGMRFLEALSSFYHGPNNILPKELKSQGGGFSTQLANWASAFEELLEGRDRPNVSNTERAGILVLKMFHLMASILFLMGFSTSEMEFDNYVPYFKKIVDLADEVVLREELTLAQQKCGSPSSCRHRQPHTNSFHFPGITAQQPGLFQDEDTYTHIKPSFALDLGIVPPLFVVATKCRDRKIRRDAIRLLKNSPRREGMWDSILCGRVAQWIMQIEEEGMRQFLGKGMGSMDGAVVKFDRRVMVKEITFDMQKREATLRCGTRGARDGDYDPRANETHIWW